MDRSPNKLIQLWVHREGTLRPSMIATHTQIDPAFLLFEQTTKDYTWVQLRYRNKLMAAHRRLPRSSPKSS